MWYKNRYFVFEIVTTHSLENMIESDGILMTEIRYQLLEHLGVLGYS